MRITQVHTIHITSLIGNDFHDLVHLETWRRCKTCFDVVIQATTWIPWRYRNGSHGDIGIGFALI